MSEMSKGQFIALKSFKKNGEGVVTPVWVVELHGRLYVWTDSASWKVKRIRNRADVQLCSSDMRGNPKGEWVTGTASIVNDRTLNEAVRKAMIKKYGAQFHFIHMMQRLIGAFSMHVAVEIVIE
jgi:PPOX class probable F420-dependent enzyme